MRFARGAFSESGCCGTWCNNGVQGFDETAIHEVSQSHRILRGQFLEDHNEVLEEGGIPILDQRVGEKFKGNWLLHQRGELL